MNELNRIKTYGANDEVLVDELTSNTRVLIVTMNTPDKLNTLSVQLMGAMAQAFDEITANAKEDAQVDPRQVVILRAAGDSFTVGLDIASLAGDYLEQGVPRDGDPFFAMWDCPYPIIGAVNGAAVTGGFEIALSCDVLLASRQAVFMDNHAKYGVHPGRRISQRLMQIAGPANASLACMSSYPIDADMALSWGLVQKVLPDKAALDEEAINVALMMTDNHPLSVRRYKHLIVEGGMGTYADGLKLEDASDQTFYTSLSDLNAMLRDGGAKFQKMLQWVRERAAAAHYPRTRT
ncbi:MAG: enoyl-CoA hydratase-related protein [Pseudomonadota bacterium]